MLKFTQVARVFVFLAAHGATLGQVSSALQANRMTGADQERLHAALDAYDAGKLSEAEPPLRSLAAKYPNDFEVDEALGSLYAESGETARSLPLLIKACHVEPDQPLARANLGALYLKLGRPRDAARELKLALARDPENSSTASNLGHALLLLHKPAEAAKQYRIAAAEAPDDPGILYNFALALYDSDDAKQATAVLEKIPADARSEQVLSLSADAAERAGDYERALGDYQTLAKEHPTDPNFYSLVLELLRHWNWPEAAHVCSYAESLYPASSHFRLAEGFAFYADSKFTQAVQTLSPLLVAEPDSKPVADLLGRSCNLIPESNDTACQAMYDFANRHPENAVVATYAAASILRGSGEKQDLEQADRLLKAALHADPKSADVYLQLGVLEQLRQRWQESATLLEHAIALRPEMAQAHYRLSRAYAHLGRQADAKDQATLSQTYSKESQNVVNARLQEVMKFVLQPQ